MTDLHEMFDVPQETLGEFIIAQIVHRVQNGPFHMEEFWVEVREWLLGQGYEPAERTIFGGSREDDFQYRIDALTGKPPSYMGASAMASAGALLRLRGPRRIIGTCPLWMVLDVACPRAKGVEVVKLLRAAEDFALLGSAFVEAVERLPVEE